MHLSTDPVDIDKRPPVKETDLAVLFDTTFAGTLAMQYGEEGYPADPIAFFEIVTVDSTPDAICLFVTNTGQRFRVTIQEIDPTLEDDPRRDKVVRLSRVYSEQEAA